MPPRRIAPARSAPVWLMGLSNASFGFFGGVVAIAVPQLLAARHIPEAKIAGITGILLSPAAWSFLLAPILDVRFSRRWYATATAALGAFCLLLALLFQSSLLAFEALMLLGYLSANLFQAALGGWLASVVPTSRQAHLSVWCNVGNIAAGGIMAFLVMRLLRGLPLPIAASLLAILIFLPTVIFLFMPAPGPDRRLARESFSGLLRAVLGLLRRREVLIVLTLFLLPSSSFALTNILGGLGADFHTSERLVSLLGGLGVTVAGGLACFLGGPLCARLPMRRLYLGIGIVGGLFTLSLILLPHTPATFGLSMLGENAFQSLAFTVSTALALRTVGHGNPLAATEFGILISAANIPVIYMQFIDGHAYAVGHLSACFAADALISIAVCTALLGFLATLRRSGATSDAATAALPEPSL